MIRKTAKGALGLVMVLYFLFLTLFGLGDFLYPDTISRLQGERVEEVFCFSFATDPDGASVLSQSGGVRSQNQKVLAFGFLPIKEVRVNFYPKTELVCGGELFGVRLETEGLLVTSLGTVKTDEGEISPGEKAGIRAGDLIRSADGVELKCASDLVKIIAKSDGHEVKLCLDRDGITQTLSLVPAKSADGSGYKAGLWIRDGAAGIGTVTFFDPISGAFAGLGHAVCDSETGVAFPLAKGTVCQAKIEGIAKGEKGAAGEIRGRLEKDSIGTLQKNTLTGVYGSYDTLPSADTLPIGLKGEVQTGKAHIVCTLDETGKKEYEIEIEEIISKDRDHKNLMIHITDPALLEKTGGIVQGMSGSPIIQNGKLVGAVTHVLVGDPTRGYGIFIENMLKNMPE